MYPCIAKPRILSDDGLWVPKTGGTFEDGNVKQSNFIIQGEAEIKELSGRSKLFFREITVKERPKPKPKEDPETKENKDGGDGDGEEGDETKTAIPEDEKNDDDSDRESVNEHAEDQTAHHQAAAIMDKLQKANNEIQGTPVPVLQVYLTPRKPKARMADVDRNGVFVPLHGVPSKLFGVDGESTGNFEIPLIDIPDPVQYQGLVVAKPPSQPPVTENWIVYAFIKLQTARSLNTNTLRQCKLEEVYDMLDKATGGLEREDGTKKKKKMSDHLKGISFYRRAATKAWRDFNIDPDDEVDFHDLLKILDMQDLFMVHPQAKRVYHAVDIDGSGECGLSEYENFLMAYDLLGSGSVDTTLLDIFDTFKMKPNAKFGAFGAHEGVDFSGFCEACHMLGITSDEEDLKEAFMNILKLKTVEKVADSYMNHTQFKKGWIQLCDVQKELEQRGLKPERGRFGIGRNRDRLFRFIDDMEKGYLTNINKINDTVEQVKKEDRIKKDEKKREQKAHRDQLQLVADKFAAIRGLEKRLLIKREQEEKSKKRDNEKLLRNKLQQAKAEVEKRKNAAIAAKSADQEKLRVDEIRQKGWDRVDLHLQKLRLVPTALYQGEKEQEQLSYAQILNLSSNLLDELPHHNFFYWLSGLRKLQLSFNRLRSLPEEIHKCALIEVLELEENRIEQLPVDIGTMRNLVRLDVANNRLFDIPESIGECGQLKYICAHSNYIQHVPATLGACFQLEYVDLARNKINELPEDYAHLRNLVHLDVSDNRLGRFPMEFGDCDRLVHLNASANKISYLPTSFSKLVNLEFCNLHSNELVIQKNNIGGLTSLKELILSRNKITKLHPDIEFCKELTHIDLNDNLLSHIPAEIGLLRLIEKFKASYNKLEDLPVEIGSLQCLLNLDVSNNKVFGPIPGPIGLLTSLRHLNLSFNEYDEVPDSVIGLQEVISINLEHNKIGAIPITITHLDTLEILDISNNRFREFPIHLSNMRNLKELNLANNPLELLPRNMDGMSRLHKLDLSRNNLKAVPVEFTSVFEGVPEVKLNDNPWDLLPKRWGKLWPGKKQTDGADGYNVAEAVDFLYGMKDIYDCAEQIWSEHGTLHYTNRRSYNHFIQELRSRIPHTWYEGLAERAKFLYFSAKENGNFPRWYTTTSQREEEERFRILFTDKVRDRNVERARSEMQRKEREMQRVYDANDIRRRAVRREEMLIEHSVNEEVAHSMSLIALHHSTQQREEDAALRLKNRNKKLAKLDRMEIKRLKEIIRMDKEHMI